MVEKIVKLIKKIGLWYVRHIKLFILYKSFFLITIDDLVKFHTIFRLVTIIFAPILWRLTAMGFFGKIQNYDQKFGIV